jgi:amino acid adenylation domain-containing protein/non-ribosomal peptide synthase protein (TIGR01720 family)
MKMLEGLMHGCWLRGICLSVVDADLKITAGVDGALSEPLQRELETHSAEVIQWLARHPDYFAARPLTDNEQALWFLHRMEPDSCAYNIAYGAQIKSDLIEADFPQRLNSAWLELQQRNTQLCSAYAERDGQALQWYRQGHPSALEHRVLENADEDGLRRLVVQLSDAPFDLEAGEVSRLVLVSHPGFGVSGYTLVLSIHHIAADLETFYIVLDELVDRLKSLMPPTLDPETYRHWCSELHLRSERDEAAELAWWGTELADVPTLELPTDFPYGSQQTFKGGELQFRFDQTDTERLRSVARSFGVTPYGYWFSLFQHFLGVLSGQNDFMLGTPSGWRLKRAQAGLAGYLVNPLPIRCRLQPELSSGEWAQQVSACFKQSLRHRNYPFSRLLKQLDLPRQKGRAPLFQHMFTLNKERTAPWEAHFERILSEQRGAAHELNLVIVDEDQGFVGKWRYNEALYLRQTVEAYSEQFVALVMSALEQPDVPLQQLNWLPTKHQAHVHGEHLALPTADAWQAFTQQCAERPEAVALEDAEGVLTYAELARAVVARGDRLRGAHAQLGDRIALCLPRGRELVMHMLASWQSGATYMALDPHWPAARLQAICADATPKVWICAGQRPDWLPESVQWLPLPAQSGVLLASRSALRPALPPELPAYVVYTSGSSGQPKGVEVSQGNLMHYVSGVLQRLALPADASLSSLASCATDLGHTALFGALLSGRRLRLLAEDLAFDAEELAANLERQPVDLLKIVPSHLNALLIASQPQRLLPRQVLVVGGEALSAELVAKVRALRPDLRIVNHYGPSETTVGVLTHEVEGVTPITLGRPLPNVRLSVRAPDGTLLPAGVNGELCVEGPTVALGYLNAPATDRARFSEQGYRTGDRVRLNQQGQIQFLGRLDEQVKIRGYRVEPAEVAAQLMTLQQVADARVLNIPAALTGNRLVAFLLADNAALASIQQQLQVKLPDYMQPALWVCLEQFPLLPNGKVDRRGLEALVDQAPPAPISTSSDQPMNELERLLLAIAAEILGKPDLRADDNFFSVGGDSILSLQIIARAKQQGFQLTPKQIFEFPTVSGWALRAVDLSQKTAAVVDSLPFGAFALTPIQHWFISQQQAAPEHWNQSLLLSVEQPLDIGRLRQAVEQLLARHSSLRLTFEQHAGDWQQRYQSPDQVVSAQALVVVEQPVDDALLEHWQQGMRLDSAPLIRWVYFPASQQLLCTAQHLIVDSVSWQMLLEELEGLYLHGANAQLPMQTASFYRWGQALQQHAKQPVVREQLTYWREQLSAEIPLPEQLNLHGQSQTLDTLLSAEHTDALLGDCHSAYGTQVQDLLLAALVDVIGDWLNTDRITVELESHGRSAWEQAPDLSRSVGWHTSRYPLLLSAHRDLEQSIIATKETLRRVPEQGIGYGLLRLDPAHALSAAGLLSFNYLGRVDQWLGASQLWRLARPMCPGMRAASSPRSHLLEVNALVVDGRLHIEWRYAPHVHSQALVSELARQFQQRLGALLDHCLAPAMGRATASDFADSGLSDDEFMGLLEQL